jgi:hypothetical protein
MVFRRPTGGGNDGGGLEPLFEGHHAVTVPEGLLLLGDG